MTKAGSAPADGRGHGRHHGAREPGGGGREQRRARPIDAGRLDELAIAYVARFATTRARLGAYLARKLRERGWDGSDEPPVDAIVERLCGAGYVDDAAYGRAKRGSLLARGYGARRIDQALGAAGVDTAVREDLAPEAPDARRAALAMARKRRFGPFGTPAAAADRALREKQVAAMLRAGHPLDSARRLIDAPDIAAAEAWAFEEDGRE